MSSMTSKKQAISLLVGLCILALYQSFRLMATIERDEVSSSTKALQIDFPTVIVLHANINNNNSNATIVPTTPSNNNNNTSSTNNVTLPSIINRLVHVTIFGLGHRLCRTTAAWHLAKSLNLTRMKFQWGTCGPDHSSGPRIFSYLFGDEELVVPPTMLPMINDIDIGSRMQQQRGKELLLRNDVYGYVAGQNFKDFQRFIPPLYRRPEGPFFQKWLESDVELYKILAHRYQFQHVVKDFMKLHQFDKHTVVGLHLRAGNGEETHFQESGRYIHNETEFVSNLLDLIHNLLDNVNVTYPTRFRDKPPLIFLATDTPSLISMIVNTTNALFGIRTFVLPQIRVPINQGVTFKALQGAGDKCLQGWQAMFSDMLLLSQSDILIAARHSSFTQSMPLSLVFDRFQNNESSSNNNNNEQPGPHFCEVSSLATTMTCLHDASSWLFRNDDTKMTTYTTTTTLLTNNKSQGNETSPVVHKLLVHLPDLEPAKEFSDAVWFLGHDQTEPGQEQQPAVRTTTHTYGSKRFNPKYRKRKKKLEASTWNFEFPG